MNTKKIYVLGGGTFNHVRNHLALATPAFGTTAIQLSGLLSRQLYVQDDDIDIDDADYAVETILTKMADPHSKIVTNEDVDKLIKKLVVDPDTKAIIFNMALVDYTGTIGDVDSGKYAPRLSTKDGVVTMELTPAEKIIGQIRKERKDIFVVGFKTTADADREVQYSRGLELLKTNSINLVVANDTVTRNNMIIAPEETIYSETTDRRTVLQFLSQMIISRMRNHFTRSTVVPGEAIDWNTDKQIPQNLRNVVNHCIKEGAYKPFMGKTVGHFAVKVDENSILTSIRKTNFNNLDRVGLVKVVSSGDDEVISYGFKPSVGGQSQRIIFKEHPDLDCIVHFHSPIKEEFRNIFIPVEAQWPNECGSHECGKNTSQGLKTIPLGDGHSLSVVYLDDHGPNIVFNRDVPSDKVIKFIDKHFDLKAKTGGLLLHV